jgi:isopenicillin-N epimerase
MPIPDLLAYRLPAFDQALASLPATPTHNPGEDESYWQAVRALYATSNSPVNLENGFWGAMAEPLKAMFQYWTDRVNFENTALIRPHWPQLLEGLRHAVAHALGCEPDEIVLTRGATESMLALISGYRHLKPGDTVLYCDLDYPAMRHAMEWLRERRGVTPVRLTLPEPATHDAVMETYARALRDHPSTKLVLLTHLSHSTGLVLPVAALADLARAAGAEVIVDAAHSWGQMNFDVADLNAPFAAFNLHKWVGAPLGCACLYIQRGHVTSMDRYFGDRDFPEDDIRARIHTGSPNFAAWLTLPAALQLHQRIGVAAKAARLLHLRNYWVNQARAMPHLEVLTPDDPRGVAGITSFRVKGKTSVADNEAIVATLRDQHNVFTVRRDGPNAGDAVRVTPAITTIHADLDRLMVGLRALRV